MINTITKPKKSGIYFTQQTEDAIIKYNKSQDFEVKNKIYDNEIHYAFFKLTENIIHTFKFYYTEVDNIEDLQHEVITFLLSKVHLYDHKKNLQDRFRNIITKEFKEEYESNFEEYVGEVDRVTQSQINDFISLLTVSDECRDKLNKLTPPKAYSYFGTIAKRYLILYNTKNYKKRVDSVPVEELEQDETHSYLIDEPTKNEFLSTYIDKFVEHCSSNIYDLFPKEYDAQIADAILELFRKRENIDIFNKKALYIYIREIVDAKTPKITKIANQLYSIFKGGYISYLENGYIKF
jgi:hypothetical protein